MDSKLFSKCSIIVDVHQRYRYQDEWKDFFEVNDLGLALSYTIHFDLGELNERGVYWVNQTWIDLCRIIMVDSEAEYEMLDEMLAIGVIEDES